MKNLPPLLLSIFCVMSWAGVTGAEDFFVHSFRKIPLSDTFYGEGADAGNFNKDGHIDVVSGPFWYAGPDFRIKQAFYNPKPFDPHGYSDNFFTFAEDFNGDGWTDILVYGFPGKDASWFENPRGVERFWPRHQVLDVVDNESPAFIDLTGDGRREIVCSSGGYFGFAEPNREDPTLPWTFRRISDKTAGGRFTHGLGYGDINGDGRTDLLEKTGWWEQPASLDGDPVWKKHNVAFSGPGGAQMYAYDFDGDGDNDVLTSLAAHGYGLAWYENLVNDPTVDTRDDDVAFKQHLIMGSKPEENRYGIKFSQLHAVDLADIDGDGIKDIITGKRYWAHGPKGDAEPDAPAVLYWFRTVRTGKTGAEAVDFVPFEIDNDSGVGVEVKARDLNGDGQLDVVVGNKKGTFVHIQSRKKVSQAEWQKAQPLPRDQAAAPLQSGLPKFAGLSPEEAAKAMTVPEGFRVELVAGEPLVHQPIALTIDHRGRLWVAEAHTYPVRAPDGEGRDKIIVLEDTDNDGQFESRKVFIDGLNLVSGLEVGFGGVWVGAAPNLMFIPDRDQDDKPDGEPEILLDGWGYQDTHETLNSLIWGPDGWLYGCHGVFTHSRVGKPGTPDEQRTPMNAGVWRYHPTRHEFEVFAWGTSNPWGVDFDDRGQAFITACVIPHLYHMIQGGRYQRQGGQHFNPHVYDDLKTIAVHRHYAGDIRDHAWWGRDEAVAHLSTDQAGGGHAHCGAMIYLGDNWPDRYRNQIFMNNVHGNRVNNDRLQRSGSGFVGGRAPDFLFANDQWFRGINLKYGPDGGVYLIDWYDKNACHRQQPEIWDRTNGRIFKVTFGQPPARPVDLAAMSDTELIELHTHRNDWYVRTARRLLQERSRDATLFGGLRKLIFDDGPTSHRLRALWTYHATAGVCNADAMQLLGDHDEYVRGWTIQLVLEDRVVTEPLLEKMADMAAADPSSVVRLYLASALQRLPHGQRWSIARGLAGHGEDARDHNLPLMIWYGVEPLVAEDPPRALALAEQSQIPLLTQFIFRRAASDPKAVDDLLAVLQETDDTARQTMILDELYQAVANRGQLKMPALWPAIYKQLAGSPSPKIRERVQFITVKYGDRSIFPALREIVADRANDLKSRTAALDALLSGKDPALPPLLQQLLDDRELRSAAIRGLARFDDEQTPMAVLTRFDQFDANEQADAVQTLASRAKYAHALLDAIADQRLQHDALTAFTVRQMLSFNDEQLNEKLNATWGSIRTTPAEKQQLIEDYKARLTPDVLAKGDLSHGRAIFKRTCAKCHRLFGDGDKIGPEITGSNRANLDYILENILDPSAVVGRDYQMTVIATADGRVVSGLVREENESAVTLQTANEQVVIPLADIEERKISTQSVMPDGQLQQMTEHEVRDLIAYLGSPRQVPLPGEGPVFDAATGRVAGAIEGESMKILEKSAGDARSQKMGGFKDDRWSQADHLWWTGAKPGSRLVLELPVPAAGRYEIFTVLTKARDYGIVQLRLNDQKIGQPIDLYNNPQVITTGILSLGTHNLSAGNHRLAIEIVGAHPYAVKAYMFGLDYVYLAKKLSGEEESGEKERAAAEQ